MMNLKLNLNLENSSTFALLQSYISRTIGMFQRYELFNNLNWPSGFAVRRYALRAWAVSEFRRVSFGAEIWECLRVHHESDATLSPYLSS